MSVRERPSLSHSSAIVRSLLEKAAAIFDNKPVRCREIGAVAAQLADQIHDSAYVGTPEMRVQAWKDLAQVTSRLGDHDRALRCLAAADEAAATCSDREHQQAIVEFVRAIVLTTMERFGEARKRLLHARQIFEKSDRRRYLLTFHQDAIIQAAIDDPRAAAQTIENLLKETSLWGDEPEMARLHTVAAHSWHKAGELRFAAEHLRKAAEINARRGEERNLSTTLRHLRPIN